MKFKSNPINSIDLTGSNNYSDNSDDESRILKEMMVQQMQQRAWEKDRIAFWKEEI